MTMETITLELLREGSPEGQMLSSLTRYFALCGNQAPETFTVPLTHLDFVRRRDALRGAATDFDTQREPLRRQAIQQLGRDVSQLVASLRCLAHELSAAPSRGGSMVHLRLVMNPLELAALPIELAVGAPGMPGAGLALSTQRERPVVITRESRRVAPTNTVWPLRPKVLFAWCAPTHEGRCKTVPWEEHLLALVKSLRPWLSADGADQGESLRVLDHATLDRLQSLCAKERFTHIHLLAHGVERIDGSALERAYDLAFEHPDGSLHRVDGASLASALASGGSTSHPPTVVTLAACDAGQVGSILGGDASIAHHLHADGIPFVVGAQLPLSFKASVVMTEVLYDELLRGGDPREALHALRRRLRAEGEHEWEWASIVAYASLPADLEAQLHRVAFARERAAIDLVLDRASRSGANALSDKELDMLDRYERRAFKRTLEGPAEARAKAHDFLGSVALRWIDLLIAQKVKSRTSIETPDASPVTSWDVWTSAARASSHFDELQRLAPESFWAGNVANELQWFIHGRYDEDVDCAVRVEAGRELRSDDAARRENARVTLLSIDFMHVLLPKLQEKHPWRWKRSPSQAAWDLFWNVMKKGGPRCAEAIRMRRVAHRFQTWITHLTGTGATRDGDFAALVEITSKMEKKFEERDFTAWPDPPVSEG